jgi:biotin operon repressor
MAKKWTPTEEKFLLENYGKVPMSELAERFGVTRKSISAKLDKLRAAHGIRPVGARDRGPEPKVAAPPAPTIPRQAASPVRRPRPPRPVQPPPQVEPIDTAAYGSKIPSGLFVKTEDGWKPILIDKEKVSQ